MLKNRIVLSPTDWEMWQEYAQFCLSNGKQTKGEEYLHRVAALSPGQYSDEMNLVFGALMMQRANYRLARDYLNQVLDQDWKHSHANLMLGILFDVQGRANMARKHFAVPKVAKLRALGSLPEKSTKPKNFRTQKPYDFVNKSNEQPAQSKDQQLSSEHSDQLYYDLVEFLIEKKVFWFTNKVMEYI